MEGSKWLISHPYHFTSSERVSGIHPMGGWASHRTDPDIFEKRTISWLCLELDQDHPACSMVAKLTTSKWEKPSTGALNMLLGFSHYSSLHFTSHFYNINFNILQFTSMYYCKSPFPSVFPTKTLKRSLLSLCIHVNCPTHLIFLDFNAQRILFPEHKSWSFTLCNFLHSPFFHSCWSPLYKS